MNLLKGYRTYIAAGGIAVIAALHFLGIINDSIYRTLETIIAGGGLAALRAAVSAEK